MNPGNVLQRAYELASNGQTRIPDPGASGTIRVDRNFGVVPLVTAAAESRTLPAPSGPGLLLTIYMATDGGDCTLTVTGGCDEAGTTSLTYSEIGQSATFVSIEQAVGTYVWRLIGRDGVTGPSRVVNVTSSTLTLAAASHDDKLVTLNRAAGVAVTLPSATGSGSRFRLFVGTTVTSNNITITRAGSDTMFGMIYQLADGGSALAAYECSGSTVITLNGSTTGGIKGDRIELIDVASATWSIIGHTSATGIEATPVT